MPERRCPICGKLFDPERSTTLPFCSLRCKRIDLGRWLDEGYGLPYDRDEDEAEQQGRPDRGAEGRDE